jgi:hypothetical protein
MDAGSALLLYRRAFAGSVEAGEKYLHRQASIQRAIARGLERSPAGAQKAILHDSLADMIEEQIKENKDV